MSRAFLLARSATLAAATPAVVFLLALLLFEQHLTEGLSVLYFVSAFIISACHALVLGLPAAFALRRVGRLTFGSLAATGFVVGAIPTGCLLLVQWATESSLSITCQSDIQCQAAIVSSEVGAGAWLAVIAAGGFGFLAAISFYVSARRSWLFQRAT